MNVFWAIFYGHSRVRYNPNYVAVDETGLRANDQR